MKQVVSKVRKGSERLDIIGIPRECFIEEWPLDMLRLDPSNIRFKHITKTLDDKEIESIIWEEPDTKDLYRSIIASGGLSEAPYITTEGVVKEGNRRIVCLRKADAETKAGKLANFPADRFEKADCRVLPPEIGELEIKVLLGRVHVGGKKEWKALNQAAYIYDLNRGGYSFDRIRELLGMSKGKIMQRYYAYRATNEYLEKYSPRAKMTDFSYFEDLFRHRELRDWVEQPGNMEMFQKWVADGKFNEEGARDIRKLPEVLADPEVLTVFEEKGMKRAKIELIKRDPTFGSKTFQTIEDALIALRSMPISEYKNIPGHPQQAALLVELHGELEKIFKDLRLERRIKRARHF
jgi:hypothetical protein